ncbi:hypothetical protein [Microlunatus antarcticus]|uniref:Uncharacterized membrane protein HdeD (DUF308 family) n=1 Tax=Microlunatus antarcticus TaxID=53388 RepID=A0A7W5JVP7_9ACTN|nr:hypothetical protein [Microlunatus antarcticus]MBB3327210.1 uncharacterized membrane protein HdeD (DUF308 family) [Microlunatus antarcticus]
MTTLDARTTSTPRSLTLRRLYLARFGFAIVWALLVVLLATTLTPVAVALLLLYPLVDLAAAVVDHRASRATRPAPALLVNMALSLLTVIGLGFAVTSGLPAVLAVWGVWAITAGIVQLVVAVGRRALGGQWPMIISGGISVLAGTGFVLQSTSSTASLTSLAGYATLRGLFFLVSGLRLQRSARAGR